MKFSIKNFFSKCNHLVTITEKTLNEKLFLCRVLPIGLSRFYVLSDSMHSSILFLDIFLRDFCFNKHLQMNSIAFFLVASLLK